VTTGGEETFEFKPEYFQRQDESTDDRFYTQPRFVNHIDDAAIAALTAFYRELLPEGGDLLDLMSSWVSHLPADREYGSIAGLGMNGEELAANPRLTSYVVHDLNREPRLPFEDAAFDAAFVNVSVQYLTRPIEVFRDVARVLRPGAPFAVVYSNRCFPTKAIALWQMLGDRDHADLIGLYFRLSEGFGQPRAYDLSPGPGSDPLYAVVANRLDSPAGSP
jgi:SAM-dependent methyltransferase